MPQIIISPDSCKGCELCVHACPQRILGMGKKINSKGYYYAEMVDWLTSAKAKAIVLNIFLSDLPKYEEEASLEDVFKKTTPTYLPVLLQPKEEKKIR